MNERKGLRGYISSRNVFDEHVPLHIQNLVIRDYCTRNGLDYLLSSVEYIMPGSTMILEGVLAELPQLEGMVMYSVFHLPLQRDRRRDVVRRVLSEGASLHAALEDIAIAGEEDAERLEELWQLRCLFTQRVSR